jgi:glycosyltransferase involved in cell wall biosynthesis
MAQSIAEHVPSITTIAGVRGVHEQQIDLEFPDRCKFGMIDLSTLLSLENEKWLYIESSYKFARELRGRWDYKTIYVPMWEQGSVPDELPHASEVVSVTKWTKQWLKEQHKRDSLYLPWPVDVPEKWRVRERVRTVLHNAGSLGGNLRKGTLEAVQIFQRSGLADEGVRLVIHAWKPAPHDVAVEIYSDPTGIVWTNEFLPRAEDIYDRHQPDLLLLPSRIEGHALVALEAMARGIPALVTDVPPINEYERNPAFLLPVAHWAPSPLAQPYAIADVVAGAEKLRAIADRDLSEKSRAVRAIAECYSWKVLGGRWEELCR